VKLVGRIPVEPLDDERLTNIERRIVTGAADAAAHPIRAPRGNLALGFALIALFIVGAGFAGWKLRGPGSQPPVVATAPIQVRTDAEHSTLALGDASVTSDPDTAFVVTRPGTGVLVDLAKGRVELEVGKRGDRAPLVVRAGDTDVIVIGTRFSVDYIDGEVSVRVTEGVVKVVRQKQEVRVATGQAWQTKQGVVALAALPERPRATIARVEQVATPEINMAETPDLLPDRVAKVPDVRTPERGSAEADAAPIKQSKADQTSRPGLDPKDAKGDLKSLIRSQAVFPALDVGEPDALKAIAIYQRHMREKQGEEHLYAFYSMAVVQSMKLGRSADALSTLERFMRRAPTSSEYFLYGLWLKVRIHCIRAIDDACKQAAEQFRRRDPDSKAATVAELITLSH
jgi:hypothetical protein